MRAGLLSLVSVIALSAPVVHGAVLTHYYPFDSDASDVVGGANGTLVAGASVTGGRLVLDGSSGAVDLPGYLIPSSGDYSVVLSARETLVTGAYVELMSQGSSGAPGWYLGHAPSNDIRVGDGWISTGVTFPMDGQWHQYALVVDTASHLYIDGVNVANGPAVYGPAFNTQTRLGQQFSPYAEYLGGQLDDVRIYSGALTGAEVGTLVPEPASMLAMLAATPLVRRRRA